MNEKLLITKILEFVNNYLAEQEVDEIINESSLLIGSESLLDSMGLVELCLVIEDFASEHNFEFDWTSDTAMSKSQSMFRSPKSLAEEIITQSKEN